jgi:Nucleotide-diphospho-sugar transferase
MLSQGILYVATGDRYVREAANSARTVKVLMPDVPIAIATDLVSLAETLGVFDQIDELRKPSHSFQDKIEPMRNPPFERTLFLDTDTVLIQDCREIFTTLEKYDLAVCHEYYREEYAFEDVTRSFPSLNTGVICFRRSTAWSSFVDEWEAKHVGDYGKFQANDQPAFRWALFNSDLRVFILPNEYNFRPSYPCFIGGFSSIKILHDRNIYAQQIGFYLNRVCSGSAPCIYGPVNPLIIFHWYWMKFKKVMRRKLGLRWGSA